MKILFDLAKLTTPFHLKRCSYQMMHLALIAWNLGHSVKVVVTDEVLNQHPFLAMIQHMWTREMSDCDIYIAKSDAYYKDINWDQIADLKAFKVCLCNSDRTFRENTGQWRRHEGVAVQTRCDLYMPINHTESLLAEYGHKTVPAAHPIDPRMFDLFKHEGLYQDYLKDNIVRIRRKLIVRETGRAGFMGAPKPAETREDLVNKFPDWVDFDWSRSKPSWVFIQWMMKRRGCIDMRGWGDKSLRFSEAAMLGRTIITVNRTSKYSPELINDRNCIMADDWDSINLEYDHKKWIELSEQSTEDYVNGWSLLSQMRTIIERAK